MSQTSCENQTIGNLQNPFIQIVARWSAYRSEMILKESSLCLSLFLRVGDKCTWYEPFKKHLMLGLSDCLSLFIGHCLSDLTSPFIEALDLQLAMQITLFKIKH